MKIPNVINRSIDNWITINGYDVVDDSTQVPITTTPITIDIWLLDLNTGTATKTSSTLSMVYETNPKFWKISLSDLASRITLTDQHTYVGRITEVGGATNMRDIQITDLSIDDDVFERSLLRLPFRIKIGTPSYMQWVDSLASPTTAYYRAKVYEGGVGTTNATSPERVTHRDAIEIGPFAP